MTGKILKIGTRGSPLALKQTEMVEDALKKAHPALAVERVIIKTSGDWKPEDGETKLSESAGGKGLFAREIEIALLAREIDCAVHSMKDMASFLPEGLALDHTLERADPRDAFISFKYGFLEDLPKGAKIGSSSLRRQSHILSVRPDLDVAPIRGNVHTRLAKVKDEQFDATFLAMAGLNRLGITGDFIYPVENMIPACGQGIVTIETREEDVDTRRLLDTIHHKETGFAGYIERAALQVLDGSCHTPIGAYARLDGNEMLFDLVVGSADGTRIFEETARAEINTKEQAEAFGRATALRLKPRVPSDIFL
jgi:hydroxymethylbilane synthase